MQIKLIQSIRAKGQQYRPPSVVDTKAIGISDADVDVLVRSGVAVIVAKAEAADVTLTNEGKTEAVAETTEAAEQTTEAAEPATEAADEAEPEPAKPAAKPAKKR
jgi:hypothetical protein